MGEDYGIKYNKKKKRVFFQIFFVLLFTIFAYIHYKITTEAQDQLVVGEFLPKQKDAKKMSENELLKHAQASADASQFQLMIDSASNISYSTQVGYIGIKNPKTNIYPIAVTLYTLDQKEIYSSGAILPGEEIKKGKLTNKLEKGTYEVKARFDIFDKDTKIKKGQQSAVIKMTVT